MWGDFSVKLGEREIFFPRKAECVLCRSFVSDSQDWGGKSRRRALEEKHTRSLNAEELLWSWWEREREREREREGEREGERERDETILMRRPEFRPSLLAIMYHLISFMERYFIVCCLISGDIKSASYSATRSGIITWTVTLGPFFFLTAGGRGGLRHWRQATHFFRSWG